MVAADWSWPLVPHEATFALAAGLGFDRIDIGVMGGRTQLQPESVANNPVQAAEEVRTMLAAYGLACSDVFLIPHTDGKVFAATHPDPEQRAAGRALLESVCRFAAAVGAPGVTGLPGPRFGESAVDIARAREELRRRGEIANALSLAYSIEPHIESIVENPESLTELLDGSDELSLTLDHGHFFYNGYTLHDLDSFLPRTRHLHLRGAQRSRLQVSVAEGDSELRELVRHLQTRYSGSVCLEYIWAPWRDCNRIDATSEIVLLRRLIDEEIAP